MNRKILIGILCVLIIAAGLMLYSIEQDNKKIAQAEAERLAKEAEEERLKEEALLKEAEEARLKEEALLKEAEANLALEIEKTNGEVHRATFYQNLGKIAKENNVKGMSVVVFKDEEIVETFNYGFSDIENKTRIEDDTCYRIASTSKMISNMLIMQLVDKGKIKLDDELNKVTDLEYADGVKLYHVLTHTSGLRDSSEYNENMDTVYEINYLLRKSAKKTPGETYCYSNFGAGTMAAIVEKLTNMRFYDYAKENLFDPLGLNASYLTEYLSEGTDVAKLYYGNEVIDPLNWEYNKEFFDQFEIGGQYRLAHGSLYISASDLAKIGMVLAGDGTYQGTRVISQESLNDMRTIFDEAEGKNYKMGLNTDIMDDYVEGRTIYGHTGSAYNAVTCLLYDPSDRTGVVVLTNYSLIIKNDKDYAKILYDTVNEAYKDFFTYE